MSKPTAHRFRVPWDEQQGFRPETEDADVPCQDCGKKWREHEEPKPTARELVDKLRGQHHHPGDLAGEVTMLASRVEAVLHEKRPDEMITEDRRLHEAGEPVDRYWLGWDDAMETVLRLLNGEKP